MTRPTLGSREFETTATELRNVKVATKFDYDELQAILAQQTANFRQPSLLGSNNRQAYGSKQNEAHVEKWKKESAEVPRFPEPSERERYILLLVDGDDYHFPAELLNRRREGGKAAAKALLADILQANCVRERTRGFRSCRVLVRIYVSMERFSYELSRRNFLRKECRSINPFVAGFNAAECDFEIIDAGDQRRHVVNKVKSTFEMHVADPRCVHIMFAVLPDDAYMPLIDAGWAPPAKVSLVQATNALRLDCNELLVEKLPGLTHLLPSVSGSRSITGKKGLRVVMQGIGIKPSEVHYPTTKLPNETVNGMIPINKDEHRLDIVLKRVAVSDLEELRKQSEIQKPCLNYHLMGHCRNKVCHYSHQPISEGLCDAMRFVARKRRCKKKGTCRAINCYRSHICQTLNCPGGKACIYKAYMHVADLDVAKWVDGSVEGVFDTESSSQLESSATMSLSGATTSPENSGNAVDGEADMQLEDPKVSSPLDATASIKYEQGGFVKDWQWWS